jgi:glycosyltransferase involved in cell wall biosynthesis
LITVVVPVYNMKDYLSKCIDSLLRQTCYDYEIVIVDDGSTDGSSQMCDLEAEKSDRIRVVHKPNGGLPSARNCGMDNARGEYVVFPDPDDWVEPDYLEHLLSMIRKDNADLGICGFYRFSKNGEWPFKLPPASVMDVKTALHRLVLPSDFSGYAWNKLFSMKIIREKGLRFDEELKSLQDLHFCFRYFQFCGRIAFDPKPLYHYNISTGVSTYNAPLTQRKLSAFAAYEKIADLARTSPCPELEREEHGQIFERSLKYIYPYYWNKPRNPEVLRLLKTNLKKYKEDFFPNTTFSRKHNFLARVATVSTRAYYILLRFLLPLKRNITGEE